MAIPVLFTVELLQWDDLKDDAFTSAVAQAEAEIRGFFDGKVELTTPVPYPENLAGTDTVIGTGAEQVLYAAATLIIGFKNVTLEQAEQLASEFSTTTFNHATYEAVDPATLSAQV